MADPRPAPAHGNQAPAILLKMPNWVGDCVMATPAIAWLRQRFPEARIDALVRRGPAGVLLDNPHLTEVITADERRLTPGERERLKGARYDAVALFPNSLRSAWLAWRLGLPRRAGFARPWVRSLLLTRPLPYDPRLWQSPTPRPLSSRSRPGAREEQGQRHMVDYYLTIAARTAALLGLENECPPDTTPVNTPLVLPVNALAAEQLDELLRSRGLAGRPLIALNPGAAYGSAKRYPLPLLARAADELLGHLPADAGPPPALVSTAAPNESSLNDELEAGLSAPLHRLGEQLDLRGLTALLDRASLLITNDSGAMHMAAARRTPTVALFGPTDWNVTHPWSPAARVLRQSPDCAPCFLRECPIDHRCMTALSPSSVAQAALELLLERKETSP